MQLIAVAHGPLRGVLGRVAAFSRDDQFAARQKFLAHVHGLIEQAARVPAQIQNHGLHPLGAESLDGRLQVVAGFFTKLHEPHIADFVLAEWKFLLSVDVFDHVDIDHGPRELVIVHLVRGGPKSRDRNFGTRLTAQGLDRLWQPQLVRVPVVDLENPVARQNACPKARRIFHGRDDGDVTVFHSNHDAEAAERALRIALEFLVFFRFHELAVRIERVEHPFERAIDQILIGKLLAVHIVLAHALHDDRKQLQARIGRVLLGRLGGAKKQARPDQQIEAQRNSQNPVHHSSFHIQLTFLRARYVPSTLFARKGRSGDLCRGWIQKRDIRSEHAPVRDFLL